MKTLFWLSCILMLLVTAIGLPAAHPLRVGAQAPAQSGGVFEPVDCLEEIPILEGISDVDCGYLIVPEDRSNPDGPQVDLAVVILGSFSPTPVDDPILYLEGGPGGSGIFSIESWLNHPLRQTRDIILLDQRGTGFSYPYLGCQELQESSDLPDEGVDPAELADYEERLIEQCRVRLAEAEGIDLSQYNSAASAADIADLRTALGIEAWNLVGVSYGTRLALTVMRDYPTGIRSVVIDSVYPPQVDAYEEQPTRIGEAILSMVEACEADTECQNAYPTLRASLLFMVETLNEEPVTVEVVDFDGAVFDEPYWGDDIISLMGDVLYDRNLIPYLPRMIDELSRRETDTLAALINDEIEIMPPPQEIVVDEAIDPDLYDEFAYLSDADGMFFSVECGEEIPFNTLDEAFELASPFPDMLEDSLLVGIESLYNTCDVWNVSPAPAIEAEPVISSIPTLVLSGEFDPVTPPDWGFDAASYLDQSYAYAFPGVGHGVIDAGDCPTRMLIAFMESPTTAPDASCIDRMPPPDFVLPGE